MFVMDEYQTKDLRLMHRIMKENSFATVVTNDSEGSYANHFPLTIIAKENELGTLEGHMSFANPQWKQMQIGGKVLGIFQGPHAYIPPAMGVGPLLVPTWNYVAVHAYGVVEVIDDPKELLRMLARSVSQFEAGSKNPWKMALPPEFLQMLVSKIVGFKIKIERLVPQLKLNQDRDKEERESVIRHLEMSKRENDRAIAAWMAEHSLTYPQ